jgi:chemotaxis protein histidine kinase CheA
MPDSGTPADPGEDAKHLPSATGDAGGGDVIEALSRCQSAWQQAQSWDTFIEALAVVEASAMQDGHLALYDICVMLREHLVQLSHAQAVPDEEQCAVLATWPSFASDWAQSPGNARLGELLVEFLRHPMWPQPLGDDEAEILGAMLGVESGAYGSQSTLEVVIDTMFTAGANDADSDGGGEDGLPGYDGLSGYAKLGTTTTGGGKIVPDVRATMSGHGSFDENQVEDLSAELDLGSHESIDEASAQELEGATYADSAAPPMESQFDESGISLPAPVEPETDAAEMAASESDEAEFTQSSIIESEFDEADIMEPEIAEPEGGVHESMQPELSDAEIAAFEFDKPEVTHHETTAFEFDEPEITEPEITASEFDEPEIAEPGITASEFDEPEIAEPGITASDFDEPEIAEAGITASEFDEPEIPEPGITASEFDEPEIAEAGITASEFEEPEIAEPEIAASECDEPEIADSGFAASAFDEPEIVEPGIAASPFDEQEAIEPECAPVEAPASEFEQHEFADPDLASFDSDDAYLTEQTHESAHADLVSDEFDDTGFLDESDAEDEPGGTSSEMGETAHEMIHLLVVEASQIATTLADIMPLATSEAADENERRAALEHFAEQVERFNGAVELLGLEGLSRVGQHFHQNILMLCAARDALAPEVAELLVYMCTSVPEYLEHPADPIAGSSLVSLLTHSSWPQSADPEWAIEVEALLASPVVNVEDEDSEERAVRASPQDVSLELPDDVDMEVLDGLLQDLPGQTAEFSKTVETLIAGGGAEDVEVAQRIAHTVKGAANTVGVAGLAHLTHHLEDILLALGKHNVSPGPGLSEVLVRAADCLESMGESLLGQCAPPHDALDTLQSVLDWANTIDNEGVAAVAGDIRPAAPRRESDSDRQESVAQTAPAAATPMVRVPAPLVDDLLRLVGETIILTGQIQERLNVTEREAQNMRKQYTLVQQLGQEMEALIDLRDLSLPQQRLVNGESFDALEFDQYNELHTCSRRLVEAATDTKEVGQSIEEHLSALSDMLSDQSRLNRENQEAVLKTRMVAVQTIVPRLQRSVRQASRLTGKPVELNCIGADTLMDSDVLGRLLDPLMHVLRNAVDHGIESEATRLEADKNASGEIRLAFHREGNHIVVRCEDDGAGLDLEAIREAAKARDILADNEQLSDEELAQLVLRPNFSTRTETTQLSGRGIGLDAVNMQVVSLGGSLRLHSEPGQGCQIIMRLPLTLISTHALLVRVTSHTMAVATRGVEQILHPDSGEVSHFGDQTTYRMVDAVYPCITLARLLGLPGERRSAERERCPALLVQADNGLNVVLVDGVADSRELVIKSMGQHLPKIRGIAGATILGDGSVTPVLDLPELLREPARRAAEKPRSSGDITGIDVAMPYALVVDDSLSARRSLAQFMTDSGFQVRTARDGVEAVKIMQARQPDVMLVDLEMPRMNGLELTHHVRANNETRDVPVIMITSRSTEKHRKQAEAAGVTQYLTKPYAEDELMEQVYKVCTR